MTALDVCHPGSQDDIVIPFDDTSATVGGHKLRAFGWGRHQTDKVQGPRGAGWRHYQSGRMESGHAAWPPEQVAVLSWRSTRERGSTNVASPFVICLV